MTGVGNYCFHLLKALMLDHSELRFFGFTGLKWQEVGPTDVDHIERFQSKRLPEQQGSNRRVRRSGSGAENAMRTRLARIDVVRTGYRHLRAARFTASRQPSALDLFTPSNTFPVGELAVPTLPSSVLPVVRALPRGASASGCGNSNNLPLCALRMPHWCIQSQSSANPRSLVFGTSPDKIFRRSAELPVAFFNR